MLEEKKKLVGFIVKEYWDKICPVCGNTNLPHIQEFDERDKLHIEICCSGCNLTVSFKLPYDLFTKEINGYFNGLSLNTRTYNIT